MNSQLLQCGIFVALLGLLTLALPSTLLRAAEKIEHVVASIARRRILWCLGLGLLALGSRAALLPFWPIPKPFIYDEFSYLLHADTFAHGRLTNSTHPLWPFFESVFILQNPSYASRYPPGQGLMMALGQVLFGAPWFGVWLSAGLLVIAICWALQGWLRPRWALLGGVMSLQICIFSYWMNSYWGGAIAAIGGALAIGAWPRMKINPRCAWIFGFGLILLMLTRPFEGSLLAIPLLILLARRTFSLRLWGPVLLLGAVGACWLGYYNFRVTGNALRLPWQEYFSQYETVPPFNILPLASSRQYHHFDLEWIDKGYARDLYEKARSFDLASSRPRDWFRVLKAMLGTSTFALVLVALAPLLWQTRRTRFLATLLGILLAGSLIEVAFFEHYAAPFTCIVLILGVEGIRLLQTWRVSGRSVGRFLVRALPVAALIVMFANDGLLIARHQMSDEVTPINGKRDSLAANLLAQHPGKHVVFVHYTGLQSPHEEWIYNGANIDDADVIWAQDMGDENSKLIDYYRGRQFWMFLPDQKPVEFTPYSPR